MTPSALSLTLDGCLTWKRPRRMGRVTRYPADYAAGRDAWALQVRAAVAETGWVAPPVKDELAVEAHIVAGGKLDTDRVLTAVLDALQGGGALRDDCRCWDVRAVRRKPGRGEAPHVDVLLGLAGEPAE